MIRRFVIFSCLAAHLTIAQARTRQPVEIPESGRVRVDGFLTDWRKATWSPLDQTVNGETSQITNARWSVAWDEDAVLYIVLQYDDAEPVLGQSTNALPVCDCIEIYVRADTSSSPTDYAELQQSAQSYRVGLTHDAAETWRQLGAFEKFPLHNSMKAAARLDGNRWTYELMVPLYDRFDATTRRRTSESEFPTEEEQRDGIEVGLDIAIFDAGSSGYRGTLGENSRPDKRTDADQIAEHELTD